MSFFRSFTLQQPSAPIPTPPETISLPPVESATFIPMPNSDKLDLLTALRMNKSSMPRNKILQRLPNNDFALYYSDIESTRPKVGIYIFDGQTYLEKSFISYADSRFGQLHVSSDGTLISLCADIVKKTLMLTQWDLDEMKPEKELAIPRFKSFLCGEEPWPSHPLEVRVFDPRAPKTHGEVCKGIDITILPNNQMLCHSTLERTIYAIDLTKNAVLAEPLYEYGNNRAFYNLPSAYHFSRSDFSKELTLANPGLWPQLTGTVTSIYQPCVVYNNEIQSQIIAFNFAKQKTYAVSSPNIIHHTYALEPDRFMTLEYPGEPDLTSTRIQFHELGKNDDLIMTRSKEVKMQISFVARLPTGILLFKDKTNNLYAWNHLDSNAEFELLLRITDARKLHNIAFLKDLMLVQYMADTPDVKLYQLQNLAKLYEQEMKETKSEKADPWVVIKDEDLESPRIKM